MARKGEASEWYAQNPERTWNPGKGDHPTEPGIVEKCSNARTTGKQRRAEGINKYPTQFLFSPFDPLVPEGKGIWIVGFVKFRFSRHKARQRKMENRIGWKMEYNRLLAFKSWGHL